MASNSTQSFEFDLDLPDVLRSLSFYSTDENGEKQLKFDPPVYQARYSAVSSILSKADWAAHIKKVILTECLESTLALKFMDKKIWNHFRFRSEFTFDVGDRIWMCRHEFVGADTPNRTS